MLTTSFSRRTALLAGGIGTALFASNTTEAVAAPKTSGPVYNVLEEIGAINGAIQHTAKPNRNRPNWVYVDRSKPRIVDGEDKTKEIQALINDVHSSGGGTILFPAGNYVVSGLQLESSVNIAGAGTKNTVIYLADKSNHPVLMNRLSNGKTGNAYGFSITDLTIDGNRWGQTFDWYAKHPTNNADPHIGMGHGILLHQLHRGIDPEIDRETTLFNVKVRYCYHTGVHTKDHGGEVRLFNARSFYNGGYGFNLGWDVIYSGLTAGNNEFQGLYSEHGSGSAGQVKSFNSGFILEDGLLNGISYATRPVPGATIANVGHQVITGLNVQNNTGPGLQLHNVRSTVVQVLTDSNNMCATTDDSGWYTVGTEFLNDKDQRAHEQANGISRELRRAKPWSFSGVELTGESVGNLVMVASNASTPQSGTPMGHQRHAVAFKDKARENRVIAVHTQDPAAKDRVAKEVINPVTTAPELVEQNSVQDWAGNELGKKPDALVQLQKQVDELQKKVDALSQVRLPRVSKADRAKYQIDGTVVVDAVSLRMMVWSEDRKQWRDANGRVVL